MSNSSRTFGYAAAVAIAIVLLVPLMLSEESRRRSFVEESTDGHPIPANLVGTWSRQTQSEAGRAVYETVRFQADGAWERTLFVDGAFLKRDQGNAVFSDGALQITYMDGRKLTLSDVNFEGEEGFSHLAQNGRERYRYTKGSEELAHVPPA